MSSRRRAADQEEDLPNDVWKYSYGTKPSSVFAMERRNRGGLVFVRWTNPDKPGADKRDRKSLGITVRDPRTGLLDPKLERAAKIAVQQFQAKLLVGQPVSEAPTVTPQPAAAEQPAPDNAPAPLTLKEGFDLALDAVTGKYASNRTRRYDQMVKYRMRLFGTRPGATPLIDPALTWIALEPKDVRALWRRLADRHVEARGKEYGVRAAEGIVDAIYSVAAWLREEHHIPVDAAHPSRQWRKKLKDEWAQRTGHRRERPNRPRHTPEEYRRIFTALSDPRVDPRIRLAIELAAECRTGQVLRCTRRTLTLTDVQLSDYEAAAAGALGQIRIPGSGKKHGEIVVFTPEQRRAVDDALGGYLANYEAAWQAGEIEDFYLFPGSRMRMLDDTGRRFTRRVREQVKPLSRDGARKAFQELEEIAGVEHRPGRGWYGLRRIATDLAETATTDDRVKDRLGGWQHSETRKHIYQDRETDQLRAAAAGVRRQLRLGIGLPNALDSDARQESKRSDDMDRLDLEAVLAALTPEQRAALAPHLKTPTGPTNGSQEKSAGTRESPGAHNSRFTNNFSRAGDRTRTGDVQLGKLAFYH